MDLSAIIGQLVILLGLFLLHKREMSKIKLDRQKLLLEKVKAEEERDVAVKKLEYLPKIMSIKNSITLEKHIQQIFKKTKATSFLILIGVNGKTSLNHISCIWYRYKNQEDDIDPITSYRNVDITNDAFYKDVLYKIDRNKSYYEMIHTMKMPESIIKTIYYEEQITHSIIGNISRRPIDENNDFLMFFSIRTDADTEEGYSKEEVDHIKLIMDGSVKPLLTEIQS